jgi:hypothetical protein
MVWLEPIGMVLLGMVMAMLFSVGVPEDVLLLPPPPPPHAASTANNGTSNKEENLKFFMIVQFTE